MKVWYWSGLMNFVYVVSIYNDGWYYPIAAFQTEEEANALAESCGLEKQVTVKISKTPLYQSKNPNYYTYRGPEGTELTTKTKLIKSYEDDSVVSMRNIVTCDSTKNL